MKTYSLAHVQIVALTHMYKDQLITSLVEKGYGVSPGTDESEVSITNDVCSIFYLLLTTRKAKSVQEFFTDVKHVILNYDMKVFFFNVICGSDLEWCANSDGFKLEEEKKSHYRD